MASSNCTPLKLAQRLKKENSTQACWKHSWTLVSLNKALGLWKTVCLPAFVCIVRRQYRTSSVSEESEGSMVRKGECNWITVTLADPSSPGHTHAISPVPQAHICTSIVFPQMHIHIQLTSHLSGWPEHTLFFFLSFFPLITLLHWCKRRICF